MAKFWQCYCVRCRRHGALICDSTHEIFANAMKTSPNGNYSTIRWIMLSQLLLALYLAFFHSVLNKPPIEILSIGLAFATLATGIVVVCRDVFFNRFEYLIHLVIGVDIFFESFVPLHQTFGFYYCAFAFWSVFWGYHGFLLYGQRWRRNALAASPSQNPSPRKLTPSVDAKNQNPPPSSMTGNATIEPGT